MRQLQLVELHCPPKRRRPQQLPPPELALGDEVVREAVRLMAQALVAVLRSDAEAGDER